MSVISGKNYRTVGTWDDYVSLITAGSSAISTNSRVRILSYPGSDITVVWSGSTPITYGTFGISYPSPSVRDCLTVGISNGVTFTNQYNGCVYFWQSGWVLKGTWWG